MSESGRPKKKRQVEDGPEDSIQNQLTLPPEIMCKILENLDFRSAKTVRLVCKSWLKGAQAHMERRGIVRFDAETSARRIRDFLNIISRKIPALPQPFLFLDISRCLDARFITRVMEQFFIHNSRKLELTRFSTFSVKMKLARRLLIDHSSTLEFLELNPMTYKDGYNLPHMQTFPKLRHLAVGCNHGVDYSPNFPAFVASVGKGNPELETFESWYEVDQGETELLGTVDLHKVKTLILLYSVGDPSALENFLTLPLTQLQSLKISLDRQEKLRENIIKLIQKCSEALKELDLSNLGDTYETQHLAQIVPVCPSVQKLALDAFPQSLRFLSVHFPGLQVLAVNCVYLPPQGRDQPPLSSLKTLRVMEYFTFEEGEGDELLFDFFGKLPGLECLRLPRHSATLDFMIKMSGDPTFSTTLQDLKYLEFGAEEDERKVGISSKEKDVEDAYNVDYSWLAALKGVEVITLMTSSEGLLSIPTQDMPGLKVLRFPWGYYHSMDRLLDLAARVERVVVTNCCSFPRVGNSGYSTEALNAFFHTAQNVECGCKGF